MNGFFRRLACCAALLAVLPARAEEPGFYPAWSTLTPQSLQAQLDRATERGRRLVSGVCRLSPGELRYDKVFGTLDCALAEVFNTAWPVIMLNSVRRDAALAAAWERTVPRLSLQREMRSNEPLRRVVTVAARRLQAGGALSPMQAYHVQCVLRDFEVNTTKPSEQTHPGEIAAVEQELGELTREFARRVAAARAAWRAELPDAAALAGMPESWVRARCKEGRPVLTLADVPEVLARCTVESTRRLVWQRRSALCRDGGPGAEDSAPAAAQGGAAGIRSLRGSCGHAHHARQRAGGGRFCGGGAAASAPCI